MSIKLNFEKRKNFEVIKDKKSKKAANKTKLEMRVVGKTHENKNTYTLSLEIGDEQIAPFVIQNNDYPFQTIKMSYPVFNRRVSKKQFNSVENDEILEVSMYASRSKNPQEWYFSFSGYRSRKDRVSGLEARKILE